MPQRKQSSTEDAAPANGSAHAADPLRTLRRRLHAHGLRFGRRERDLAGPPDLVLPRRRSVIFLRGCFWHAHGCKLDRSAGRFHSGAWAEKIDANKVHDAYDRAALLQAGWQVETVWECQVDKRAFIDRLAARLLRR